MTSIEENAFAGDIGKLEDLLSKKKFDEETRFMLESFIELLSNYPVAVSKLDLVALNNFMESKSSMFNKRFNRELREDGIKIAFDESYSYHYVSVSIISGTRTILFPFMLVIAANYRNFISLLFRKIKNLKGSDMKLIIFFDVFCSIYIRGKPKLFKRDISFCRELVRMEFEYGKEYYEFFKKIGSSSKLNRLKNLGVIGHYIQINFPSLGLIPYMHFSTNRKQIPEELNPFIEYEKHILSLDDYKVFRLFLLPAMEEKKLSKVLSFYGITERMENWFYQYNWDYFNQTTKYTWRWNCNFINNFQIKSSNKQKIDLLHKIDRLEKLSERLMDIIDIIHHSQFVNTKDLSIRTNVSIRTVNDYVKRCIDSKILRPVFEVMKIGLDEFYQLSFKKIDPVLEPMLESFPLAKVMKSENLSRYLIFLPTKCVKKLEIRLNELESQKRIEILSKGRIVIGKGSIERGTQLNEILKCAK